MYTYFNQETTGTRLQTIPDKKYLENLVKKRNNRYWSVIIVETCYVSEIRIDKRRVAAGVEQVVDRYSHGSADSVWAALT